MQRMLRQSRISEKNILYLQSLTSSEAPDIAEQAAVVLAIAMLCPGRRHRARRLKPHDELWTKMVDLGLVDEVHTGAEDQVEDECFSEEQGMAEQAAAGDGGEAAIPVGHRRA